MVSPWNGQFSGMGLVAKKELDPRTVVRFGHSVIGGGADFVVIAGPCSVENEKQLLTTAEFVKSRGAQVLRGGAYKPRSSPYAFQGLGVEGLKLLKKAREATGLPVITEALSETDVEVVAEYADIVQVGARSMENYSLLEAVGRCGRPVLLKRGMGARLQDLLRSAEVIAANGNPNVILCERGIRTFENATRNTLDISAVPVLNAVSHLPVVVDPSHACGIGKIVPMLARAAVAVEADGLMVEVHPDPKHALSDGDQSLTFSQFEQMMNDLQPYLALRAAEVEKETLATAGGQ
jgi:3-deoxy-7-phosphoheptulonate synthase